MLHVALLLAWVAAELLAPATPFHDDSRRSDQLAPATTRRLTTGSATAPGSGPAPSTASRR